MSQLEQMKHEMNLYRFNFNRKTYKSEAVLVYRNNDDDHQKSDYVSICACLLIKD